MAALVCDICGGKLAIGSGGIAVCDSCGMEHTKERMQEKVQEIKGTVRVDNSHMIDNWMKMGNTASQAGNNREAYNYFTKVIEIDNDNWRAIYEKGKAGAWQSTLGNLRIPEIYQGITIALEILNRSELSEDDVIVIKNEFAVELFNINNAITDLMEENLSKIDNKYIDCHWDQMWETRQRFLTNVNQLEDAVALIADLDDELSENNVIEFKKRICRDLRKSCNPVQYWNEYSQESLGYFGYNPSEKKKYIDKFWDIAYEIRKTEPDFASETDEWNLPPDPFEPGMNYMSRIMDHWAKVDGDRKAENEKQIREQRVNDYWEAHQDEKKSLELEKKSLVEQISHLNKEISQISRNVEKTNIEERISKLTADKNALGVFKGKEKKALQEQLDILLNQIRSIDDKISFETSEINRIIHPLKKRITEIDTELTKNR